MRQMRLGGEHGSEGDSERWSSSMPYVEGEARWQGMIKKEGRKEGRIKKWRENEKEKKNRPN